MMLMDGNRIEDLQRMYTLFARVDALESLRQALSLYIRKTGQSIVMDEEKDKDMVSCLLEFKASLDTVWEDSFSKNEVFCNIIKDAFEHLINLRQVSIILLVNIFYFLYLHSYCSKQRRNLLASIYTKTTWKVKKYDESKKFVKESNLIRSSVTIIFLKNKCLVLHFED